MSDYKLQIIESAVLVLSYILVRYFTNKAIEKIAFKYLHHSTRVKLVKKVNNVLLFFICAGIFVFIWGVQQKDLLVVISSVLTILGIAFFAQWSIISNITATLIIFFNHPAKIGDYITIHDKEYPVYGRISDIGVFFVIIKTDENELITIPSNVFLQKVISKKGEEKIE